MNSATASASTTISSAHLPSQPLPGQQPPQPQHHQQPQDKNFSPLVRQSLDYLRLEKHFSAYTLTSSGAALIQYGQSLIGEAGQLGGAKAPGGGTLDDRQTKCEPLTIRE